MKIKNTFLNIVFSILLITIFISSTNDAEARKKRYYNPEKTKAEAVKIIRSADPELAHLAGFDPLPPDSIDANLLEDLNLQSELLNEGDIPEDADESCTIDESEEYIDIDVTMEEFTDMWVDFVDEVEDKTQTESGILKDVLMKEIVNWLGTPYRFGGNTDKAIDCSAFIQQVFRNVAEIELPRTARTQIAIGDEIDRTHLEFGDLIFFHTYSRRFASHVGIYLTDDLFVHASSRYGVTVSSLKSTYYNQRFIKGKRISVDDLVKYTINEEDTPNKDKYTQK